jgi:conflict system STAND superfamily ATPase
MNALPASAVVPEAATTVDARNPWLGLASFTEETRAYFFGREEEVAELARRVQRKLLTVLFGQSGLGKTSILRAGLVPRLRSQGYCPIYVRIDYSRDSPEPAEQLKQAIQANARRSGQWTQVGVAVAGESLWEFLHHRDDVLLDESGRPLIPLLIFDQFEEIFTLAQSDEFGRARAARFVTELADLVENRPPKALEARFDEDESAAGRFDFARSDYRVLIALREDYLAPLEGLKKEIPSIGQNRLRLAPMSGTQALAAVLQPGKGLVSEEVAAAIVRFVAGGAELANAVVEPSLLSLICRELNDARIAQGRSEISLDLLAGSHATILQTFYERALADQPSAVRRIIEDDLLTDSGFRENVAEESLVSRFNEAGAAPDTLAVLVNRRLLRIEERLDVRRVELTHDVLCSVVKASRDQRHEREAREATEKLLADQKARELAAHRTAVRARQIASVCTVLAIGAIVAAGFAYISSQRAHRAEREAVETRAVAEKARAGAEHLLGYLSDDFARELESFGRLDVLAEFSKRQIDYFHALPPVLRGTETTRNAALSMVYRARALRSLGNLKGAGADAAEARQLLAGLQARGDASEATLIALALAEAAQARVLESAGDPTALPTYLHAADRLRPIARSSNASLAARRAYVDVLVRLGFQQQSMSKLEDAVRTEEEARRIATSLGARDLTDLDMGAYYAEASAWEVQSLVNLGRDADARRVGEDSLGLADRVLERRPGYRLALHAEGVTLTSLANLAQNDLDPKAALRLDERDEQVSLTLLKLDPSNVVSWNNLGVADSNMGDVAWSAGRPRDAFRYHQKAFDASAQATPGGAIFYVGHAFDAAVTTYFQTQIGDFAGAQATIAAEALSAAKLRRSEPAGSNMTLMVDELGKLATATVALEHDDFAAARREAAEMDTQLEAMKPNSGAEEFSRHLLRWLGLHLVLSPAAYGLGDFAAVEQAERTALAERKLQSARNLGDQRDMASISTWLAMALAREGRRAEAAKTIAPVVSFERGLAARNHGDMQVSVDLAAALYVTALTDAANRAALLHEASGLLTALPSELRNVLDVQRWRTRIQQALQGHSTASVTAPATRPAS